MGLESLRRKLPSMLGGPVETENLTNGQSYLREPEKRAEKVREQLFDNLPEEGRVEAELRMDLGDEELDTEHYSGLEEVKAAYETWMTEYDFDEQILTGDLVKYDDGGEFEIRIQEVDNLSTMKNNGPHHPYSLHDRDKFSDMEGHESISNVEVGETVAVLEGEYEREV